MRKNPYGNGSDWLNNRKKYQPPGGSDCWLGLSSHPRTLYRCDRSSGWICAAKPPAGIGGETASGGVGSCTANTPKPLLAKRMRPHTTVAVNGRGCPRHARARMAGLEHIRGSSLQKSDGAHNAAKSRITPGKGLYWRLVLLQGSKTQVIRREITRCIFLSTVFLRRFWLEAPVLAK